MSIDLSALFAVTENAVASMVATSGTTVRLSRTPKGRGDGTVDRDTLTVTPVTPSVLQAETGAVLAPYGSGGTGPTGTATEVQIGDLVCVLLVQVEDVRAQDLLTVLTCRDPRLVDRELDVISVLDSSAGAARVLHVRPRTGGGS